MDDITPPPSCSQSIQTLTKQVHRLVADIDSLPYQGRDLLKASQQLQQVTTQTLALADHETIYHIFLTSIIPKMNRLTIALQEFKVK